MMQKSKWLALALVAVLGIAGCNRGGGGSSETVTAPTGDKLTTSDTVEVMVFEGGYGKDFYEKAAEEYKAETGITVNIVGDPRIDEQVKPRFVQGNPPDLTYPGWRFDHWRAVDDEEVMKLDSVMGGKAWKSEELWKDTFEPSILKLGYGSGGQYVLPYFYSVIGWWYDPDLFAANGWAPPTSYTELLALCQKMRDKGIAPITYQGQYPDYMISGMLTPWAISVGGIDQYMKMQNLEPGAWNSDAVVRAAKMIRELRDMGYFQSGATAMSHTESQSEFVNNKAAMIPCGTWLYSEMENTMPKGRKMKFFLPPVLGDGKGDPSAIMIKIEPWFVPQAAKNQEHAIGFYKYMTSREKAKQFVTEKGTLMAVKGANEVDLPMHLQDAAKLVATSSAIYAPQWRDFYPAMYKAVETNITKLVSGDLTPEQFGVECEKAAEEIRNDSRVTKRTIE